MFEIYGKTHVGSVREHNEDAIWYDSERGVALVADGLGGHNAGEVASRITAETFANYLADYEPNSKSAAEIKRIMIDAFLGAHKCVKNMASENSKQTGMATTAVACCLNSRSYNITNVGDSRAYVVKENEIRQITQDHSFVQEMVSSGVLSESDARNHPERNIIKRCIGSSENLEVDYFEGPLTRGDRLLLCSDGVHDLLDDREILAAVSTDKDARDICAELVNRSMCAGGNDNISVILAVQK